MKITVNLASATGTKIKEETDSVVMKLTDGNITVLPEHIPFISSIKNGYIRFNDQDINIEKATVHFKNNELYVAYFK